MSLPSVDDKFLINTLVELLNIPSPSGFAHRVISLVERKLSKYPDIETRRTRKGALIANWQGNDNETLRGLTAHADTLGAMVKEIKSCGRLKLSKIGGVIWNTVESEGCTVFTSGGEQIRGSILFEKASSHVFGSNTNEVKRNDDNMEVRLDARTSSKDETRALGIEVGDFVAFDPRVESINGFVRSRHLDDKAGVACILAAVEAMHREALKPSQNIMIHISNYEEVGHGAASGFPSDLVELVVVDMAALGEGQASDEYHVSLCVKDSKGPYHHGLSQRLRNLAKQHEIDLIVDIYPHYGSDGGAFWRAGGDVALALIGPGVDASHNYERTHTDALTATTRLLMAYLVS